MGEKMTERIRRMMFSDKMHGFGVYHFANGHCYEGAWHEGKRQGLGMYTFRNGEIQAGHWQNGVLDILSTQNAFPGSPIAVNHSKVLNAVQEARRATEKAFDVPIVDERVNKAVAAANKQPTQQGSQQLKLFNSGLRALVVRSHSPLCEISALTEFGIIDKPLGKTAAIVPFAGRMRWNATTKKNKGFS